MANLVVSAVLVIITPLLVLLANSIKKKLYEKFDIEATERSVNRHYRQVTMAEKEVRRIVRYLSNFSKDRYELQEMSRSRFEARLNDLNIHLFNDQIEEMVRNAISDVLDEDQNGYNDERRLLG